MKTIAALAFFILNIGLIHSAEIKSLILPGGVFGSGWELTQPNIKGASAAPNYINRTLPGSPIVSIQIIAFSSETDAKERLERKMGSDGYKQHVKKASDDPIAYEQSALGLKRRYVLIKNYWLTVDQLGNRDDRASFIQKYTEHLKKNG